MFEYQITRRDPALIFNDTQPEVADFAIYNEEFVGPVRAWNLLAGYSYHRGVVFYELLDRLVNLNKTLTAKSWVVSFISALFCSTDAHASALKE